MVSVYVVWCEVCVGCVCVVWCVCEYVCGVVCDGWWSDGVRCVWFVCCVCVCCVCVCVCVWV